MNWEWNAPDIAAHHTIFNASFGIFFRTWISSLVKEGAECSWGEDEVRTEGEEAAILTSFTKFLKKNAEASWWSGTS